MTPTVVLVNKVSLNFLVALFFLEDFHHNPHFPTFSYNALISAGTAVAQWLRRCATNRKVAGSIPDGVIGIIH